MANTTLKELLSKGKLFAKTEAGKHRAKMTIGSIVETEATENSPDGTQYLPITLEYVNGKTDVHRVFLNGFNIFSNEICQQLGVKELDLNSLNNKEIDVWVSYSTGLLGRTYQNFHYTELPTEEAATDASEQVVE
jgi:hypothetical protein